EQSLLAALTQAPERGDLYRTLAVDVYAARGDFSAAENVLHAGERNALDMLPVYHGVTEVLARRESTRGDEVTGAALRPRAREDYPFSVYFSVKLLGTALGLGAIAAMALGLGYRGATLSLILAVAVAKSFEAVSELVFGLLQRAEDMRRIAVSMLAKGTVSVLAVGVVLKLT